MSEESCRIDVWLWRARFFKTRALSAGFVEKGLPRLVRPGQPEVRLDKPSRTVRPGDRLVFALGGRVFDLVIEGCGERRGPAAEARTLYRTEDAPASAS
ncbi:MAG TPA: RNA-binding S4 domain-containing protein [Caulobacteraceae bacterium]|nr:RNA-binding S4 domain-containing protein [Caulobacteraceae bacterium]